MLRAQVVTDGSLASLGLLNLSQVNKFFYYYLRDRKKMHWLWAAVRDKEWPGYCCNPYTLRVSEVKMVHLIQGTNCCVRRFTPVTHAPEN